MNLSDLEHLLEHPSVSLKWYSVNGEKFGVICYMVSTPDLWKMPLAEEARGIVFNENGDCVCRPFEKFWNVGEREETQVSELTKKFLNVAMVVQEKIDGSLIAPVVAGGRVVMKSKKSFTSDVAEAATKFVQKNKLLEAKIKDYVEVYGATPIFEYTSPSNQVVIPFENESLTLLALRFILSGSYAGIGQVKKAASEMNVARPKVFGLDKVLANSIKDWVDHIKGLENTEGCVLIFGGNTRVKVKTDWYLARHRICTDLRIRDIADLAAEEKLDDYIPEIRAAGVDVTRVEEIGRKVAREFAAIQKQVDEGLALSEGLSDKDTWLLIQPKYGGKIAGIIMSSRNGKDTMRGLHSVWKEYYRLDYPLITLTGF